MGEELYTERFGMGLTGEDELMDVVDVSLFGRLVSIVVEVLGSEAVGVTYLRELDTFMPPWTLGLFRLVGRERFMADVVLYKRGSVFVFFVTTVN
jgi:hypothetical protein